MIVGLAGFAQVGKDTAAANMGPGWSRRAFADELKAEMQYWLLNRYRFDPFGPGEWASEAEWAQWNEMKRTLRPLLVAHGACRRALDPEYWIKALYGRYIDHWFDPGLNYVITDVRYLNEAVWIVERMQGRLVYISRPGFEAANDEEERSIAAIRKSSVPIRLVANISTKERLGQAVLEAVQ